MSGAQLDSPPAAMQHRSSELQTFKKAVQNQQPVVLHGPPGTGKTATVKYVQQHTELPDQFPVQYVNCWKAGTTWQILYELLEGLTSRVDLHHQATPTSRVLQRLERRPDTPVIACLDEVQKGDGLQVLYRLIESDQVIPVAITDSYDELLNSCEDRVQSRLATARHIEYEPYSRDELEDVVRSRINTRGASVLPESELSDIVNSVDGDARQALAVASKVANSEIDSDDALNTASVEDDRSSLKQHERILLETLEEKEGWQQPGDVYEAYRSQADDPRSKRMMREYLSRLVEGGFVKAKNEGRWRKYRAAGGGTDA